jgi:GH15 family glucan-1,4-alpha-glucosidase
VWHAATVPLRIEDYALIGDTQAAGLVGRDGSIDWLCLPRFDSGACFAALLGDPGHGRWLLAPAAGISSSKRAYRPGTLVLETEFETNDGAVRITDCMPPRQEVPDVVRLVEGVSGRVRMRMELVIRFDYGKIVPWVRQRDGCLWAVAGPDALVLKSAVPTRGEGLTTVAEFEVAAGDRVPFVLTWHPAHVEAPPGVEAASAIEETDAWWREWSGRYRPRGAWGDPVERSLITLKALTYGPTGGVVAAPTTSLPEDIGGVRNWDYRFCWLRDATLTLYSLLQSGYVDEAREWRDWLLRAVAGRPAEIQIMYGPAGERRLTELELDWLPGYEGSRPVRIGNAAVEQLQLDVFGEVLDTFHQARRAGLPGDEYGWRVERALLDFLESNWTEPDEGIWEVRSERRHFTHSKVMAWAAFDRAIAAVEEFGLEGPAERWRRMRADIHEDVCRNAYDPERRTFTQSYGSTALDASLLLLAHVGFLPADDPRVRGTVEAVERELCVDGFVLRYDTKETDDGLPGREGAFLACTFWLADALRLIGRTGEAHALFERLLALRNDVGLLSEEYDPDAGRLVGNFPQAFSHVALVNTARNLSRPEEGPAQERPAADEPMADTAPSSPRS